MSGRATAIPAGARRMLDDDEIEAFRRDGAVCLRGSFDPLWIAGVERTVQDLIDRPTPRGCTSTASFVRPPAAGG